MGFSGLSGIRKLFYSLKYGKQIGAMNRKFEVCFGKRKYCDKFFTTINAKTGEVVRRKNVFGDNNYRYSVFNKMGDVVTEGEHVVYDNVTSLNSHSNEIRNIRREVNSMGQAVHRTDVTFTPSLSTPSATVLSNVDGKLSKTYMNTITGDKCTIHCID